MIEKIAKGAKKIITSAGRGLGRALSDQEETIASAVNERTELPDAGVAPTMTVKVIRVNKKPSKIRGAKRGRTYTRTIIG